ncbi:MAG TPA: hypothetical protein V6C76_15735 [Drouetiella sp.]
MYWRVRKASVDQLVRKYGVHVLLVFSVLMNGLLIVTRPNPSKTLSKDAKVNYENFARTVTQHLLDTNYITYKDSTLALIDKELAPPVVQALSKAEMLAGSQEELFAQAKSLTDRRQFSAVRIEEVTSAEPNNRGLIPIDVKGVVAIHSAEESGPSGPVAFKFRYLVGNKSDKNGAPSLGPDGKPLALVAGFEDLTGQAQPQK